MILLDSGVIAAFLDRDDSFHAVAVERVRRLATGDRFVASAVTFAEVLAGARLGRHDLDAVRGFFAGLVDEIVPVDEAVADQAAELRPARGGLRMPDAFILATAAQAGVDLVMTTDRRFVKALPGVRIDLLK